MTIPETHHQVQAVRRVYENEQPDCASASNNIIHIACHPDPSLGQTILLWDDLLAAFQDEVIHVRSGTFVLPFLKGPDFKNLDPLRIAAVPGATLDVVARRPLHAYKEFDSRSQAALEGVASSSSNAKDQDLPYNCDESFSPAPPEYSSIVTQDLAETKRRAKFGDKDAQAALGDMYKNGQEVRQDYQAAMDWYLRAANQGLSQAQYNIGGLYDYGLGVSRDFTKAKDWYLKAAAQNYAPAQTSIGDLYANGQGVSRNYSHAMDWFLRASSQGDSTAQNRIGCLYQLGNGVPQDSVRAMYWYERAATQGYAEAQNNIGYTYHFGRKKDYSRAMDWYLKAANQGHVAAQHNIGWLYEHGQGVSKDVAKAMEWYNKAADGGNDDSKKRLDKMERRDCGANGGKNGASLSRLYN